jgi:altronate dehydratase
MTRLALRIRAEDDVAVALADLAAGTDVPEFGVRLRDDVPRGHKFALRAIAAGASVSKYAHSIGIASAAIAAGAHVHSHNLAFAAHQIAHSVDAGARAEVHDPALAARRFSGYRRADGRVGTRNFIGILTSVNCSATVARQIARRFGDGPVEGFPGVDGVAAFTHSSGCGMAHTGEGIDTLRRTIAGYARQPNFGGVLLIGLGCEVNQLQALLDAHALMPGPRLRVLGIQEAGGTQKAIERGVEEVRALITLAAQDRRESLPLSGLSLALQCGGSDGWSGISANPALGAAADRLVAAGGSVVLSETPEIYGAEALLLARAETEAVAARLRERLAWWERYAAQHGTDLNNNPSPGNIAGGLTTILEKSLGAVAKGGKSSLRDVLLYAEPMRRQGLQFMDTPGYDPCSATGQIAGGCNLMAFTTGRGAVFGAKPVPSIKLASNSELARRQAEDIDVDCGGVVRGEIDIDALGALVFERLIALASGDRSASEKLGFGEAEFVPWQLGAVV